MSPCGEVTLLLHAWRKGETGALNTLVSLMYPVLHDLAAAQMRRERPGHTLQPTALLNEAFLRLARAGQIDWKDRAHFLAISARLMRQVLVDNARSRTYEKRGGGVGNVSLQEAADQARHMDLEEILTVHLAIEALEKQDLRKAQVVELRFFGGLTVEEIAGVLGVSEETVNRDWRIARAWLLKHISETESVGG